MKKLYKTIKIPAKWEENEQLQFKVNKTYVLTLGRSINKRKSEYKEKLIFLRWNKGDY